MSISNEWRRYYEGYTAGIAAQKETERLKREAEAKKACEGLNEAILNHIAWSFASSGPVYFGVDPGTSVPAGTPSSLPDDAEARNQIPMADGLLYYFPNALAEVAKVSKLGNDQHNPGQPVHWARAKSKDHANKILRHLVDAGNKDSKGIRHSAYLAWRALALLQIELEEQEGAPRPRNAY